MSPVPTGYTELTLAQFMHKTLGRVATALEFGEPVGEVGDYEEAVTNALLMYGETDITQITGSSSIKKIRQFARVQAWQMAQDNAAANIDFTTQGTKFSASQIHKQISENLEREKTNALEYDPIYYAELGDLRFPYDPYAYTTVEERGV